APSGTQLDIQRLHAKADRVLRGQGNNSGRQRLGRDAAPKAETAPRGLILGTGEDVPRGHSLRARLMVLEFEDGTVDELRLTKAQDDAADGLYAKAMAGFVSWLAARYERVRDS